MAGLKVGILGCGVISRTYALDLKTFYPDRLELAACADVDIAAASQLASEFDIPKACTTQELLDDPEIDIVINLTPPWLHVSLNTQIIQSGKHLFSEKPFARTAREAGEVLALAERKGVKVGCAPDTFLGSGIQSLKFYLDAGLIGKPFFATANMTCGGHETWHPSPVSFYQEGSGPLYDMAPYYLSALVILLGPIESIAALSASPSPVRKIYQGKNAGKTFSSEVPTHYTCILKFAQGTVASLNVSFDISKSNLPLFELYGDGGTLSYPDPNFGGGTPKVYRREQFLSPIYQDTSDAHARAEKMYELPELFIRHKDYSRGIGVVDLADAIENGTPNRAGGELILHITEAIEGITACADTGTYYRMQTTCRIPAPRTVGGSVDEL